MNILSEVRVDRLNEKGVFVAEQILNILHNTLPHNKKLSIHQAREKIPFAFEVMCIEGKVRFFISAPDEYMGIFENQIYAHFPNVEIARLETPLIPNDVVTAGYELAKSYIAPIKIYTNLKDRSEKETIDPLSSITSAVTKATKDEFACMQVVFSPIYDASWKSERIVEILTSHRPKWMKKLLVGQFGWVLEVLTYPFKWLYFLIKLVAGVSSEEVTEHTKPESEAGKIILEKITPFGYAVTLRSAARGTDSLRSRMLIAEISASLSILGRPDGNTIVRSKKDPLASDVIARVNNGSLILNTAELAGLVHMPTIYVRTPGINWVVTKKFEPPANLPTLDASAIEHPEFGDTTPIGTTNFR